MTPLLHRLGTLRSGSLAGGAAILFAVFLPAASATAGHGGAAAVAQEQKADFAEARRAYGRLEDEEALEKVRAFLQEQPEHVGAREFEARCLWQLRRGAEAVAPLEAATGLSPRGRLLLAECRAAAGDASGAVAAVGEVIRENPRLLEARLARVRILLAANDLKTAAQELGELRRADPARPELAPVAAQWAERARRPADALRIWQSILDEPARFAALDPHVVRDAEEGIARLQFEHGRYEESARGYAELVRRHPRSARLRYLLGMSQGMALLAADAIESLRRALELDPAFHDCRLRLAELYRNKQMVQEAIAEFERLHEVPEHRAEAARSLAQLLVKAGETERAARLLPEIEQAPPSAAALEVVGLVREKLGEAAAAKAAYRSCLELDPLRYDVLYRLALLLLRAAAPEENADGAAMMERYQRVVPVLPDVESAVAALRLSPGNPNWMVALAGILNVAQEYELARSWAERALKLRPDDPLAQGIAGCIAANQRRDADALRHFERAQELSGARADPKLEGYVEALRRGEPLPLPLGEIVRRAKPPGDGPAEGER